MPTIMHSILMDPQGGVSRPAPVTPGVAPGGDSFAIFSPRYYYLTEVPSQVLLPETVLIFLFAVISSGGAAYAASKRISSIRPSEVLRYE